MILEYKSQTQKQLKKLSKTEVKKIIKILGRLQKDPHSGKKLKGEFEGLFSLRAWPYRIIYTISAKTIIIYSIVHHQSAYK